MHLTLQTCSAYQILFSDLDMQPTLASAVGSRTALLPHAHFSLHDVFAGATADLEFVQGRPAASRAHLVQEVVDGGKITAALKRTEDLYQNQEGQHELDLHAQEVCQHR
jgi:hypothetical protein